ncbi:VanZ family protein [Microbacterium sp. No. 7]|uniref:VanZ family protein n=1 Tax=Microbacterium sp. No. 7 TaxID=1714373 RepID=UPI0006D0A51B|nr:VanZ family protein [Microbacterium sp. No. 7]ALJ22210.1 VanZ family protein [Microbacterium sp. No. 7]
MVDAVFSAAVAILFGAVIGVALFVPFVAISYRRRGGLTLGRGLVWAAALVYFIAIWTYTLLPLPQSEDYRCAPAVLSFEPFVQDIADAIGRGHPLTDFALLQIVFNVLLFLPLGFFLRVLARRGVLVAFVVGALTSLLIETTQLTGVWGLFPCAYRMFDVGDLLTNTTGAVVGSLLALLVPRRWRDAEVTDAGVPRPLTKPRRLLAMLCDALAAGLLSFAVGIAVQVWLEYGAGDHAAVLDGSAASTASTLVPIVVWAVLVLATGRTVGDIAVELRYRGGPLPALVARPLRFLGGIGGYLLLGATPWPWTQPLFALVALVAAASTAGGAGLPAWLSRQRLTDARAGEAAAE